MDRIVNTRLLAHPANWAIVWTVALFVGFAFALAHEFFSPVTVASTE